jgi:hypothetical protein
LDGPIRNKYAQRSGQQLLRRHLPGQRHSRHELTKRFNESAKWIFRNVKNTVFLRGIVEPEQGLLSVEHRSPFNEM